MPTRSLILLTLSPFFAALTQPQQDLKFPTDGNGLLEYCGPVVTSFDSPGTLPQTGESHGIQMMKQGWCAGRAGFWASGDRREVTLSLKPPLITSQILSDKYPKTFRLSPSWKIHLQGRDFVSFIRSYSTESGLRFLNAL